MLTVDEITAQVDHRRASVISFGGSDDDDTEEELAGDLGPAYDPGLAPQGEDEEELEEDEDEDEEYESESEEEDEEDEQPEVNKAQGQKFTSAGANRSIKWSKGALVGAGSFGQVYLGLDLQKGLLMAVKQVDIRGGVNTANEGRKKEMVTAMQREIELLKELHHENIVQYLGGSACSNANYIVAECFLPCRFFYRRELSEHLFGVRSGWIRDGASQQLWRFRRGSREDICQADLDRFAVPPRQGNHSPRHQRCKYSCRQ